MTAVNTRSRSDDPLQSYMAIVRGRWSVSRQYSYLLHWRHTPRALR